jgi:hypothetical protein
MFHIVLDTNVWIDLAGNFKEQPLLIVLEQLVREKKAELIVPTVVNKEFAAKREGTEKVAAQRAASAFTNAKSVVELLGNSEEKEKVRKVLADFGQKYPLMSEVPKFYVERVQALLNAGRQVDVSAGAKVRAAERAMDNRAPCHGTKNSINDAVLIEMYGELVQTGAAEDRFVFVSKNHHDFSAPKESNTVPHPHIADYFQSQRSHYFISLPEALKLVGPEELEEENYQASGMPEPRTFSEISDAIDLLWDQIWYNRHKVREEKIADGKIKLVEAQGLADMFDMTKETQEVWSAGQQAARRVEEKRGLANLGPWTDFDWGMLNGKLSALRWILGDEWDFLDT